MHAQVSSVLHEADGKVVSFQDLVYGLHPNRCPRPSLSFLCSSLNPQASSLRKIPRCGWTLPLLRRARVS